MSGSGLSYAKASSAIVLIRMSNGVSVFIDALDVCVDVSRDVSFTDGGIEVDALANFTIKGKAKRTECDIKL